MKTDINLEIDMDSFNEVAPSSLKQKKESSYQHQVDLIQTLLEEFLKESKKDIFSKNKKNFKSIEEILNRIHLFKIRLFSLSLVKNTVKVLFEQNPSLTPYSEDMKTFFKDFISSIVEGAHLEDFLWVPWVLEDYNSIIDTINKNFISNIEFKNEINKKLSNLDSNDVIICLRRYFSVSQYVDFSRFVYSKKENSKVNSKEDLKTYKVWEIVKQGPWKFKGIELDSYNYLEKAEFWYVVRYNDSKCVKECFSEDLKHKLFENVGDYVLLFYEVETIESTEFGWCLTNSRWEKIFFKKDWKTPLLNGYWCKEVIHNNNRVYKVNGCNEFYDKETLLEIF